MDWKLEKVEPWKGGWGAGSEYVERRVAMLMGRLPVSCFHWRGQVTLHLFICSLLSSGVCQVLLYLGDIKRKFSLGSDLEKPGKSSGETDKEMITG